MAASGGDAKLFARVGAFKIVDVTMMSRSTSVALAFDASFCLFLFPDSYNVSVPDCYTAYILLHS